MRTIVMLVLLALISHGAAAQAQDPLQPQGQANTEKQERTENQENTGTGDQGETEDEMTMEEVVQMEEATNDFLGLKWGAGIGVMGSFGSGDAVEKASVDANNIVRVDEEGDMRPQLFLEMHSFWMGRKAKSWRRYQQWVADGRRKEVKEGLTMDAAPKKSPPPLMGYGPFVALQSSNNEAIDALTLGLMWGIRRDPGKSTSLNIGIGLSFDPSVQVLGGGLKEGEPLPENETAVRYKKEGQFGWAVMASFTF